MTSPELKAAGAGSRAAVTAALNATRLRASPLLSLKGVSKAFGANQALSGVDFEVDAGEVVALVGDNGAGKSTLIKAIAGVQLCRRGRVLLQGQAGQDHEPSGRDGARHRDRLPGPRPVRQPRRRRQPLPRPRGVRDGRRAGPPTSSTRRRWSRTRSSCSTRSRSRPSRTSARTSARSPAASARRWRSPARCSASPSVVLLDEPTAALGVSQTEQVLAADPARCASAGSASWSSATTSRTSSPSPTGSSCCASAAAPPRSTSAASAARTSSRRSPAPSSASAPSIARGATA